MKLWMNLGAVALLAAAALVRQDAEPLAVETFHYDPGVHREAHVVAEGNAYDGDFLGAETGGLSTWLEHVPGKGDRLLLASLDAKGQPGRTAEVLSAARLARPTLTRDGAGSTWLSWEEQVGDDTPWRIVAREVQEQSVAGELLVVRESEGNAHSHRACATDSGLWFVWQEDHGGQYDVFAAKLEGSSVQALRQVSTSPRGDWAPDIAGDSEGNALVVWDAFDGQDFEVLVRGLGPEDPVMALTNGPEADFRPRVAADPKGGFWIAWEVGSEGWGREHRSRDTKWNNSTDTYAPLHGWRSLRVGHLTPEFGWTEHPLPMPSVELASTLSDRRDGVWRLGTFYEAPCVAVAAAGHPWLTWRHLYETQLGCTADTEHHIEIGWKVYTSSLRQDGWTSPEVFDAPVRDGAQRTELEAFGDSVAALWTTGRTDRRKDPSWRGLAMGVATPHEGLARKLGDPTQTLPNAPKIAPRAPDPAPATVGTVTCELFFGDLHRHTDLSLCFPFFDGSLDDAYRYGIEVAELDFLGVTDHSRDLAVGDVQSQVWSRTTKAVRRHGLAGRFFPLFAFERSHGDTDHNIISLRDDMLRNFPPPLPTFWKRMDRDTLSIPHSPFQGKVWDVQDDERRPLAELYQGFRDQVSEDKIHAGLERGYTLGFIASSDHLSTSASYAGVWSPERTRTGIFRSLQARRTFAATDRIRLLFTCGSDWLGSRIEVEGQVTFDVEVTGTAPLERVEIVQAGQVVQSQELEGDRSEFVWRVALPPAGPEPSWYYARVVQTDGGRAWSSPIWVSNPADGR